MNERNEGGGGVFAPGGRREKLRKLVFVLFEQNIKTKISTIVDVKEDVKCLDGNRDMKVKSSRVFCCNQKERSGMFFWDHWVQTQTQQTPSQVTAQLTPGF